jgi:PAS domain S-box-containing protein
MSEVFREGADPVIIINLQGEILDLNDESVRAYGYAREDLLGQPLRKIIPPARRYEVEALLNRCRDGEAIRNIQWTLLNRLGDEAVVLLSLTVLTGDNGKMDAIAVIARRVNGKEPG